MRERVLLVAPANSYRTFSYLDAARRLGVEATLASEGEHALVAGMFDGVHVDLQQPGALDVLLATAQQRPFAGVVATDDASVELGSKVAQALGLPHNAPEAARLSRRKDLARTRLQDAGLPVPAHRSLDLGKALAPQLQKISYPCVVKPLALSASRGVIRVNDSHEMAAACERIGVMLLQEYPHATEERTHVLVEAFIAGPEFALEGILHRGSLHVLAIFDKPDSMEGPFFEETYYVTPSRLAAELQQHITDVVVRACVAYGLQEGPVHAELRIADGVAWIMEVASRTIGGHCGRLLRFGTGVHLEDLVISHALGETLTTESRAGAAGVLMIPIPGAGVLRRVEGMLEAQRVRYIEEIEISLREGYELVPLPEGDRYLGFIFAEAPTPEQAEQALRDAHEKLKIIIAPLIKIKDER
jgi:biotin carboxylase